MSVFKEIDACFPVSNYGLSKYWGEQQTKLYNDHYGMPATSIRSKYLENYLSNSYF